MQLYAPPLARERRPLRLPAAIRSTMAAASGVVQDRMALAGLVVLTVVIAMAIFAPLVAPYDPVHKDILRRLKPPLWVAGAAPGHLLGTDALGRDVLSRIIFGARASLVIGFAVLLVAGSVGTLVGMISGYCGGTVDEILMRLTDIQIAFPGLLLALTILTVVGPGVDTIIIALAINGWMVYARLVRGQVLSLREQQFVEAAISVGCKPGRVLFGHVLPHLASPLLTLSTLELARVILAEAILSFLGMGVQPPDISWGLMMSDGHDYLDTAWWVSTFPGVAVSLTVLSVNVLANWLRTTADPTQRFRQGLPGA